MHQKNNQSKLRRCECVCYVNCWKEENERMFYKRSAVRDIIYLCIYLGAGTQGAASEVFCKQRLKEINYLYL